MSKSKTMTPEARNGLNRFKMEAANEAGVNLKQGYNGDLTSRNSVGHEQNITYIIRLTARWKSDRKNPRSPLLIRVPGVCCVCSDCFPADRTIRYNKLRKFEGGKKADIVCRLW